jgi:hypothetical protein
VLSVGVIRGRDPRRDGSGDEISDGREQDGSEH